MGGITTRRDRFSAPKKTEEKQLSQWSFLKMGNGHAIQVDQYGRMRTVPVLQRDEKGAVS